MSFENKLDQIIERYEVINQKLSEPLSLSQQELIKLSKEQSEIVTITEVYKKYKKVLEEICSLEYMINDLHTAEDFKLIAEDELYKLYNTKKELYEALCLLFIPKDFDDHKNVIMEIRAGTGGEEASLFAALLLRMYKRYTECKGWIFDILSITETGLEGCKEAVISISGSGVFERLKFESGVHRVQRVPETEASGRIHTSAATVAILPEPEEVDIQLEEKDLKIDVYRAGGAGGQHVNTTDSAVRITHIPTGIVVCQQDEKSQHRNKAKALKILRSRVYEQEKQAQDSKFSAMRKEQVGSGDRSERIRTYNFPQNRLTDHRINMTLYSLNKVLTESELLDELIDALIRDYQSKKMAQEV